MKAKRNSSLELVRIICIILVVYWHSINPYLNELGRFNLAPANIINTLCNNTNLLFMLLSGYFGIRFGLKKLIALDISIIFYDVLHLLLFGSIGAKSLLAALMPITFKNHWFLTYYFAIAILSGFLNQIPEKMSRTAFRNLLLLLVGLFYVFPTVFFNELIEDSGKGIVCMTIVYLIGRYLRMYYSNVSFRKSRLFAAFWIVTLAASLLNFVLSLLKNAFMGMYCRDNSIFILITAILFFLFFREMNFTNKLINHLSPNIVILYCIEGYVREFTNRYFDLGAYVQSPLFILICAGYAAVVILLCLLINELRRLIFGRLDDFLADWISKLLLRIAAPVVSIASKVSNQVISALTLK